MNTTALLSLTTLGDVTKIEMILLLKSRQVVVALLRHIIIKVIEQIELA
jgi:hypothetical protein